MEITLVILLTILIAKHFAFDYMWQTPAMLAGKGIYGNWWGVLHSLLHSWGTGIAIVVIFFMGTFPLWIFLLPALDFSIHYNVDYIKAHYGPGIDQVTEPIYWFWHGLDQFMHYATYVLIAVLVFI